MINSIKTFFSNKIFKDLKQGPTDQEIHLATAALLLEVSHADFEISDDELAVTAKALQRQFNFSEVETQELLQLAIEEHKAQHSLHPFLQLVNENFSIQQKRQIIVDLWKVAYADRNLDKYEEHRIRKIADLLYVSHKDFITAKLKVQDEMED